ncbi:4Fe-4S dicluster domain-containing protein [Halomicrobium salinisoli]|uniref:nitrate reductase subunit beta n=1 Tax=Halomicrobium salinisoli TaxID=2878391 RepID=UPI001CF02679|nr:4Fe-4S dicluster domain-containing protein [Halomicrobium salinisoli]
MSTDEAQETATDDSGEATADVADGIDHQVAMVLDLNKCIGCQTCTMACKTLWTEGEGREYMYWNNVETKPGEGYPRGWEEKGGGWQSAERSERSPGEIPSQEDYGEAWEFNHSEIFYDESDEPLRPQGDDPEWGPNWDEDQGAGEYPNSYYFYLPRICNHCTHPTCVEACPRKAVYKREEDGIVLIDQERCRGYRYCVEGCPYKKVYYNAVTKTSEKCVFCFPRLEGEGADGEVHPPACASECPPQLRLVGYLDDEDGPIYKLVEEYGVALPLHPEFETAPNVYYVPPYAPPQHSGDGETIDVERIPRTYLEELFGEAVHDALDTIERHRDRVRRGGESELMDILTSENPAQQYRLEVFDDA